MSWIDAPVLVHVGLPKTGTTWFQEVFLPSEGSGFWIPPVQTSIRVPVKEIGHALIRNEQGHLLKEQDFDAGRLRSRLAELAPPAGLVPVVSNERLAGHPLSGGYDRLAIARRIREVFPRARVMVTIRAQTELIFSNYVQYLRYGGWHTPEAYLRPPPDIRMPSFDLSFWDYDRLEAAYSDIFGPANVLLVPQELLRRDAQRFAEAISTFAGAASQMRFDNKEVHPRKPVASGYLLRRLTCLRRKSAANAFIPPLANPAVDRLAEKAAKFLFTRLTPRALEARMTRGLKRRVEKMVDGHYDAGNRRFAARQQFDLAELGYRL